MSMRFEIFFFKFTLGDGLSVYCALSDVFGVSKDFSWFLVDEFKNKEGIYRHQIQIQIIIVFENQIQI